MSRRTAEVAVGMAVSRLAPALIVAVLLVAVLPASCTLEESSFSGRGMQQQQQPQQQQQQRRRPAKIEWSRPIWRAMEANPSLPTYDIFVSPQLLLTKNGSILSFVAGRKCDPGLMGCEDNSGRHDVLVKRSDDGGSTFGAAVLVHSESTAGHPVVIGNPAAVLDASTGRILIFLCRNNTEILLSHSDDHGSHWAPVRDVTPMVKLPNWGWYATTFSGIQLKHQPPVSGSDKNGRLVVCCDHQDHLDFTNGNITWSYSHVLISDDHGATWFIGGNSSRTTNECAIAELSNGTLIMSSRNYVRSRDGIHRAISWSHDGGESFTAAFLAPSLPSTPTEGGMTVDSSGNMLVYTHPANPNNRDHESVFSSVDGGASWQPALLLDANYSAYSSVIALSNGSFAVQYDSGSTHMHRCNAPPHGDGCYEQFAVITFMDQGPESPRNSVDLDPSLAA